MTIDNCPAQQSVLNLNWVQLISLRLNRTSITQPMDQGIIPSLNTRYLSLAAIQQITAFEKEKEIQNFSILTAIFLLTKTWNSIPDQTFINCFKKSGISDEMKNDEDDPFCGLNVKEDVMETYLKDVVKDKIQCRL